MNTQRNFGPGQPRPQLLALAVFAACHGMAAQAADVETGAVVVVATTPLPGVGLMKSEIAAPVQTATAADLSKAPGRDISAFMNDKLSGVTVNEIQGNPFQMDVSYRGYTASPLLGTPQGLSVYLDGVRMNQPFGDVVSWDLIPRNAISSLALMPGSNPLFGLNTLGGALSLQTKDGLSHPGTAVQTTLGSHNRRSFEFEHGGSNDKGVNWFVAGNLYKDDGWREASPSDVRQIFAKLGWMNAKTELGLSMAYADNRLTGNGLQEQGLLDQSYSSIYTKPDETINRSVFLNLSAKHNPSDSLLLAGNAYYRRITGSTVNGDVNQDSLGQNPYLTGTGDGSLPADNANRRWLFNNGYAGQFPTTAESAANTAFPYWSCLANTGQFVSGDATAEPAKSCNGLINRTFTQQENYGFSGQFTLFGDMLGQRNQFTGGLALDMARSRFRQTSQYGYINPDRSITPVNFYADGSEISDQGVPYDNRVDLTGKSRTWSVFASDTLSYKETLHLTLSGRFNETHISNRDAITPGGGTGSLDADYTYRRFNPALGLSFTPAKDFSAYVGYNEGSRTPTAIELGCADPANPCKLPNAMAGDPPLRQVVTRTWETGVRGSLGKTASWRVGLFRSDNADDILFVADNQAGYGYFKNFGKTRREGLELGADARVGKWSLDASYTYLDATYRSTETVNGSANSSSDAASPGLDGNITLTPGNRMPLVPRHILKLNADYAVNGQFAVGMGMQGVSSMLARGNENGLHQADGVYYLGSGKVGAHAVFNLNGRYQPNKAWTVSGGIDNLFDRRYASAAQLGATAFSSSGSFIARPFPIVGTDYPLVHSTFYAPGAPRSFWLTVRYDFGKEK